MAAGTRATTNVEGIKIMIEIQPRDTSRGHFYVSLVKSGLRIIAGGCIIAAGYSINEPWLVAGGALLLGAEIVGIVEEVV